VSPRGVRAGRRAGDRLRRRRAGRGTPPPGGRLESRAADEDALAWRLEAFVAAGGAYVYGSYPDIDGLFHEQASETDRKKREAILHRIQQLMHEKALVAPIWELAFINGHGPRAAESGLTLITNHAYSSPYEDLKLKVK